jgi:NitT/TauT family transport system permease protein
MRARLKDTAASGLVFAGLLLGWELACSWGRIPTWLVPAPSRILGELWLSRDLLPQHILATALEVVAGFGIAVLVGVPLSIVIVLSPLARRIIYPLLLVLQSVPKVALAPIILLWIGYGTGSKLLIAAVTAFFPIIINTSAGMEAVPRELLELSRSFNARRLKVFWMVRLPFAMPYLFSGMKVAMSLALIGAVVGEFVGSDRGLGYLILTFSSTMNTALVFGAMVLLSMLGIGLFHAVAAAERIFCPWYVGADKEPYV